MEISSPQQLSDEDKYSASEENWRELLRSNAWKDLASFVEDSIEIAKELLALAPEERAIPESDQALRGGIKVLRSVLGFPEQRLSELEAEGGESGSVN